jgi:hypothetical protein
MNNKMEAHMSNLPYPLRFKDGKIVINRQIQDSMNAKLKDSHAPNQSEYERVFIANLTLEEMWELAKIDAWNEARTMEFEGFEYQESLQTKAVLDGYEDVIGKMVSLNFKENMKKSRELRDRS